MSNEYFYEDDEGILKENTRESSDKLRTLAGISLSFNIIIGVIIIFFGLMGFAQGAEILGIGVILAAIIVIFYGYVNFVIISAIATAVENSDRSDVVDAIHELTDTIREKS